MSENIVETQQTTVTPEQTPIIVEKSAPNTNDILKRRRLNAQRIIVWIGILTLASLIFMPRSITTYSSKHTEPPPGFVIQCYTNGMYRPAISNGIPFGKFSKTVLGAVDIAWKQYEFEHQDDVIDAMPRTNISFEKPLTQLYQTTNLTYCPMPPITFVTNYVNITNYVTVTNYINRIFDVPNYTSNLQKNIEYVMYTNVVFTNYYINDYYIKGSITQSNAVRITTNYCKYYNWIMEYAGGSGDNITNKWIKTIFTNYPAAITYAEPHYIGEILAFYNCYTVVNPPLPNDWINAEGKYYHNSTWIANP